MKPQLFDIMLLTNLAIAAFLVGIASRKDSVWYIHTPASTQIISDPFYIRDVHTNVIAVITSSKK